MHMEIRSSEFVRYQVKVGERQTRPAGVRGDDAEQQRLDRSAPKHLFHVPAHRGYAEGFGELGYQYMIWQLETIAMFWKASSLLGDNCHGPEDALIGLSSFIAHQYVVHPQAWQQICDEYHADGDAMLRVMPSYRMLDAIDETMQALAFSTEEAQAFACRRDPETIIETVDDVVEAMHSIIEIHVKFWS